jgi:hypothetical protein
MRRSLLLLALLIGLLVISPGCGGGHTVWVTGKLLKGGSKYEPPKDQLVTVTFVPLEVKDPSGKTVKGGDAYQADYDPASGTFTVPGPDRQGIPPGKYRVAVTQKMERTAFDAAKEKITDKAKKRAFTRETDMLADRYGPTTSPITVEVTRSEEAIVDLDQAAPSTTARPQP